MPQDKTKLHAYHFSAGNSTGGPIGFTAMVYARSRKEAVETLAAALPEEGYKTTIHENNPAIGDVVIFFNTQKINPRQIIDVVETPEDEAGLLIDGGAK